MFHPRRIFLAVSMALATQITVAADPPAANSPEPQLKSIEQQPNDNLRTVHVERFGVKVRVPQAWRLIAWAQDDRAFALRIPQEQPQSAGQVSCELALAPESLEEYQKRHQKADVVEQQRAEPRNKLQTNEITAIDAASFGATRAARFGRRLDSLWMETAAGGQKRFELRTRLIADEVLYTFTLQSDEQHFDAYRQDFEEMLAAAELTPPDTGVKALPGGYFMQREYRFAFQLPPGWKPAFGQHDKVLFFATGKTHQVMADNLLVLASPRRDLDFAALKTSLQKQIAKEDPAASVEFQERKFGPGNADALETVVKTERGPFKMTVLEWRFCGPSRNYEVKFTCESGEFEANADHYRRTLESFIEVAEETLHPAM